MSNLVGFHRSRPGARSVGGQGSSYDISFVRWGYRNMMVRLLSETKKDLVWRVCIVKNAHIHFFREGTMSARSVQKPGGVWPLGVPFNIASYALLTLMVAQVCDLQPGEFIWTGGDCHLYANHLEQADLQLSRDPLALPTMKLNPQVKDLFAFSFEDFELVNYQAHPHIKAPVAV